MSLGSALRAIRLEKEMTQEELIERAELSRSQIYYIESGKRIPKLATIQSICIALGISIYDLVCYMYRRDQGSVTPSISSMGAPGATIG